MERKGRASSSKYQLCTLTFIRKPPEGLEFAAPDAGAAFPCSADSHAALLPFPFTSGSSWAEGVF